MPGRWTNTSILVILAGALLLGAGCPPDDDDDDLPAGDDDSTGDDDSAGDDDPLDLGDGSLAPVIDADHDGWTVGEGDCDDGDPAVFPTAEEADCDGIDSDCDGSADLAVPGVFPTIQSAVDAAVDGDDVCIAPGTYEESVTVFGLSLRLIGIGGPEVTAIDAMGADRVVTLQADEPVTVAGLTLTGGVADQGGGVWVFSSSDVFLEDLLVTGNEAASGGGVYIKKGSVKAQRVRVIDNQGTGIYVKGGMSLSDAIIAGNQGRGIGTWRASPALRNCLITGNSDEGFLAYTYSMSGPHLTNVVISGNGETGLYCIDSSPTLRNVAVLGNQGSGIVATQATYPSNPVLENVIVAYNAGGGILDDGQYITFSHTNVWGNTPVDFYGLDDPTGTDGNVSVDPGFLDVSGEDPADWDLHLAAASPLIDAGDPSYLDPDSSPSDIGPFGGTYAADWDLDGDGYPAWWQPGEYDFVTYPALGWDCDDSDAGVYPGNGC